MKMRIHFFPCTVAPPLVCLLALLFILLFLPLPVSASDTNSAASSFSDANSATSSASDAVTLKSNRAKHSAIESSVEPPLWRIRFFEAAVVQGPRVLLGEVAMPAGPMPHEQWQQLAQRELWVSPPEAGRAMNMTRPRLQEAVVATMHDLAPYCLFPGSLAIQRGGAVLQKDDLQKLALAALVSRASAMDGETNIRDLSVPSYIFLRTTSQQIVVDLPQTIQAGRVPFRFLMQEVDGKVMQKFAASAFLDVWVSAPAATTPLNRGDILTSSMVTHTRINLAHTRETPWDGRGGPWRVLRPVGILQPIYQSDVGHVPAVTKGAKITLIYEASFVRVTASGEALTDGALGERIAVRNTQSKKNVYGVVRNASTIITSSQ